MAGAKDLADQSAKPFATFDPMNYDVAVQGLNQDQLKLLSKCRHDGLSFSGPPPALKLRTGHITMEELIGPGGKECNETQGNIPIMERLRNAGPVTRKAVLEAATEHVPLVPGFPIPIRIPNRGDMGHMSTGFRPELYKTTMEAYASASAQESKRNADCMLHLLKGASSVMNERAPKKGHFHFANPANDYYCSEPDLIPWMPDSPTERQKAQQQRGDRLTSKFSATSTLRVSQMRGNGGQRHGHGGQYSNRGTPSNQSFGSHSVTNHGQQNSNQKTRKPYFMPYKYPDAVERGLKDPESKLFKGVLRVNQRNYEESYIDNPEGDDQLDILILGVHDRNRALHGDLVVVKIKEREHWVVHESPYKAWCESQSVKKDEIDVKSTEQAEPLMLTVTGGLSLSASDLVEPVLFDESMCYSRKVLICVAAQMEMAAKKPADSEKTRLPLQPEIQTLLQNLGINKTDEDPDPTSIRRLASVQTIPKKTQAGPGAQNRRSAMRTLGDLPEDSKIVPDSCLQKTAEVVFIAQQKNCRTAMGQLKVMADGNRNWALFSPNDPRMPRMMIPADELPTNFFERPQDYQKYLFVAKMINWAATAQFARGKLERHLGLAGDIEAETEGLLFSNNIDTKEFSPSALSSLPISEATQWHIEEKEFKYRMDLRDELIFTIDPATARDLDDALHIKPCPDVDGKGTPGWEIGVHIADVTHFLLENSELDNWARERATSTYLVHKVIPMLPRLLCEELCSLNPGVDRLCFSVMWKIDTDGEIHHETFARTIIRSRCKLAYEHAQEMLDFPDKEFTGEELPKISDGCTSKEISTKVHLLMDMARKLRAKRQESGALRLDQPKLKFALDATTHMPTAVGVYVQKDANRLVEEYMLLANTRVAKKIEEAFPQISVLRRHPSPKGKVLQEVLELCEKIGFPIDASSSKALSSGLRRFEGQNEVQSAINQVLSMLMMKPMQLAQYFCTGTTKSVAEYYHYALATPYYTHFTSPIRRYPDVMVHRLLSAACGYTPPPTLTDPKEIALICGHCNDKKYAAKAVSEASADTFFGLFVKHSESLEEKGVVVAVLDASFDVLVFKYGVVKRVYVNRLDMARDPLFQEGTCPRLTLYWKSKSGPTAVVEQVITICSVVDVVLSALPEPTKYQAVIKMQPTAETGQLKDLFADNVENLGAEGETIKAEDSILDMRAETIFADLD